MHESVMVGGGVAQPYRINSSQFERSVIGYLAELHESRAYTDVLLHAEGKIIPAHRVILAAGSGYFKSLFSTLPPQTLSSVVVALPGVRHRDLEQLVRFVYYGHVDVVNVNDDLERFIALAKELKVVGMGDSEEPSIDAQAPTPPPPLQTPTHFLEKPVVSDEVALEEEVEDVSPLPPALDLHDTIKSESLTTTASAVVAAEGGMHIDEFEGDNGSLDMSNYDEVAYDDDDDDEDDEEDDEEDDDENSKNAGQEGGTRGRMMMIGHSRVGGFGFGREDSTTSTSVKPFVCIKCGKAYNSNKSLWRHKKFTCDEKIEFKCVCGKVFSRSDNLRRHVVVAHHGV